MPNAFSHTRTSHTETDTTTVAAMIIVVERFSLGMLWQFFTVNLVDVVIASN